MKCAKLVIGILVTSLLAGQSEALAQTPLGDAFTFQGQLKENGNPGNAEYDLKFRLYNAVGGPGGQIGGEVTVDDWPIVDGQVTVQLDFGPGIFNGDKRWLEIDVRPGASSGPYTTLSPRQELTPAPYALYALDGPGGGGHWTLSGGGHIYNNNSGNVGIGTSTPFSELHVAGGGAFRLQEEGNAESYTLLEDRQPGQLRLYKYANVGASLIDINPMPLEGIGSAAIRFFRETESTGAKWVGFHRGNNTNEVSAAIGVDGGHSFFQLNGGNFGIGLADPAAKLEVVGDSGQNAIQASSPLVAVYGLHDRLSGSFPGVWGESNSTSSSATGVRGIITSTSPGSGSIGVLGYNKGTNNNGYGVKGWHDSGGIGVYGIAETGIGVRGISNGGGDGISGVSELGAGVRGVSNGTGITSYGGIFGDFFGSGKGILVAADSHLLGQVGIGTVTVPSGVMLIVDGTARVDVLEIVGADLAEKFPVSEEVKPGMVVAIDPKHPGKLCLARGAYNRCVAGVVSGANGLAAGAVLGHLPGNEDAPAIALTGRVWVYCDASNHAITPGDLLTTSDTAGHAMKVTDHTRAQGAVLGKAMSSLESGKGLVLVLVQPQ